MTEFKVGDYVRFKDDESIGEYYSGEYEVSEITSEYLVILGTLPAGRCTWYPKRLELVYQLRFKWK